MRRGDVTGAVVVSAVAAAAAIIQIGAQWALLAYVAAALATGPLAVIDLREHRLPNAVTLPAYPVIAGLLVLAALLDGRIDDLVRALLAGLVALVSFVVLHLVNPSGMGMGDVKLAGPLGMLLGWISWQAVLWGLFLGFMTAALWSLALLAARRATRRSQIAFGPFMLLGLWLTVVLWS